MFGNPVKGRIGFGSADVDSGFRLTRPFDDGSLPQYGKHDGCDAGNGKAGDPIIAMRAGKVTYAGFDPAAGGAGIVRLDHGDGWSTGYAHLQRIDVRAGQSVSKGAQLGQLGNTGWSHGAHIHFDTTYQGQRRDPWPMLEQQRGAADNMVIEGFLAHVQNRKTKTTDAANFRASPSTKAEVIGQLVAGASIIPIARCKGTAVGSAPDKTDWYANIKTEGLPGEAAFLGYLHSSVLTRTSDGKAVLFSEAEDTGDEAGAAKAAADAVRDASVKAANDAAKQYGA